MPAQNQPTQELTLSEKMKLVQYLAIFPAISILIFTRRKLGFRMLKPSRLIGVALLLMFVDGVCATFGHQTGLLFTEFPWVMLMFGFFQRYRRWKEICRGERWHTFSSGISYLELLPLPALITDHRRIYRFIEPALCFIAAMLIGIFFSRNLAQWIAFSSVCLFIYEQTLFEKQLDRDLDILDGLVAAEVQSEVVEHFAGEQPDDKQRGLQDTAGIPTGVAFDIHRQIERRRAKQAADEELAKTDVLLRQAAQIKRAAKLPKNITPAPAELPPTAPDNIAPESLEPPPPELPA